jgi:SAM-dependent methyltransferase
LKIQSNKEFYEQAVKEYGVSAQGVHWNSKYTQYKRFEIITKLIKKEINSSTIIDVGCGFGEYYNYLLTNNYVPKSFIGVDCEQNMINIARRRFPNVDFFHQNILTDTLIHADYYLCSGALNILNKKDIKLFISKCFEQVEKGFIFNYLKHETFHDISQDEIINICKNLTQNIKIKENYLENDFTILMVK